MMIEAIAATAKPLSVTEAVTTQFHMPTEMLGICDKHYILYWQARYVYTWLISKPRIVREGIGYVPVLQDDLSLQEIGANPEVQLRLSFRKLRGHRTGHVLIRRPVTVTGKI